MKFKFLTKFILIFLTLFTVSNSYSNEISVKLKKIEKKIFYDELELNATIYNKYFVEYYSQVHGTVDFISPKAGKYVKKGEILIKIDEELINSKLKQAQSNFNSAESNYLREKSLFEKKMSSKQTYEKIKSEYHSEKFSLESAISSYKNMIISAPFDSFCDIPTINVGNIVKPGDYIVKFVSNSSERTIKFFIPNRINVNYSDLKGYVLFNDKKYYLKNLKISKLINKSNGSYSSEAEINDAQDIPHNLFTKIYLNYNFKEDLSVDEKAIISSSENKSVYLYDNGVAKLVPIKIISRKNGYVQIKSDDIKIGDIIVVDGISKIYNSAKIKGEID